MIEHSTDIGKRKSHQLAQFRGNLLTNTQLVDNL
jgi:hypothetical protein